MNIFLTFCLPLTHIQIVVIFLIYHYHAISNNRYFCFSSQTQCTEILFSSLVCLALDQWTCNCKYLSMTLMSFFLYCPFLLISSSGKGYPNSSRNKTTSVDGEFTTNLWLIDTTDFFNGPDNNPVCWINFNRKNWLQKQGVVTHSDFCIFACQSIVTITNNLAVKSYMFLYTCSFPNGRTTPAPKVNSANSNPSSSTTVPYYYLQEW